ncbi:hypothetical protein [Breoghania sp.]|uniref:hypothetical protein n=1 Tax=Breoghania sp. TaxID=2065378 RepID=UPI002624E732|nr:hypothetical protein [Breoghania sp.]MDJ0932385.1 hypothetical protein [Breoghania sp.]
MRAKAIPCLSFSTMSTAISVIRRRWSAPSVGKRVDFIGAHLKSKFAGDDFADVGKLNQRPHDQLSASDIKRILKAEQRAVEARIKLTTECINIRYYIENRFRNEPYPAIFLLGDMNYGVGREYFERKALFHDLISNLQGDVFFARRFLNHALFDYKIDADADANYRWSIYFEDAWDPGRDPRILIDHILFAQSVVGDEALERSGLRVRSGAGLVEHTAHVAANTDLEGFGSTSDHRSVSVTFDVADPVY